jgi:hypothetical protein
MPTSEAVGAIARGKALIVVGDPKQMPPTSFFSSTNVDEDEVYIDDMESILEDCKALDIPSLQLNWHYRSRHESLIAFSNNEYYGGQLITFPSVDDQETKVKYIPVEGWYDKGGKRNNRAEAEAIVNEIVRRLEDPELCKRSIGVISFSVVQQYLIEDLLQDRLDSNAKLRDAAEAMYEPIFVKNLENVQGDERDIILFSIGYGPTKDGTVSMNFGPLNNVGGERRLNVAVSRARMEMYVFSTLKSSQIDLSRSKAKGVEGLKHFLEYAEFRSVAGTDNNASTEKDVVIAEQLAAVIRERGYNANVAIGRSAFKVDIAISQKSAPETYFMGILLDGKGYMNTQTTRDREIVQPGVLANLNWKIMRVWSVDWYRNPQRVIDRVMETIAAAEKYKDVPAKKEEVKKFDISREKIEKLRSNAMPYVEYKYSMNHPSKMSALVCRSIVSAQQPITFAALCKVVCSLRGLRTVSVVQNEVSEFIHRELYVEQDRGFEVVWLNEEACRNYKWFRPNNDSYSRTIDEIPLAELKNAVAEAIAEQLSLAPDNLIVVASKKMGFTRRGVKVEAAFMLAIERLKQDGAIVERDGRLYKD